MTVYHMFLLRGVSNNLIIMAKKVVTVTHPDGTKKVIVGKQSNGDPVKSREVTNNRERRAKPLIPKAGITSTKTAYKLGGKVNVRKR